MASDGKVISFINMKGGVGKTTLCREIGYTLNKKFKKSKKVNSVTVSYARTMKKEKANVGCEWWSL